MERKGARQRRAAVQRAENGRPPLGTRLTGYTPSGAVIEREAAVVREMFARFAAGESLRGIVAWLDSSRVRTRHGGRWNPSSVRTILVNARFAGRAVYMGEATGDAATWPPIVAPEMFDAVRAKLDDPRRRTQNGTDRRHLGSSLYLCGVCDRTVRSHSDQRYRCPAGGHVTRMSGSIDAYVIDVIRARLALPDLADLLADPDDDAARALDAEVRRLRKRLRTIEADYDGERIDGRRYKIATDKASVQLAAAEVAQARLLIGSGAAGVIGAPDPVAAFDAGSLMIRRTVLAALLVVRLLPAPRGVKFDPATLDIRWIGERSDT